MRYCLAIVGKYSLSLTPGRLPRLSKISRFRCIDFSCRDSIKSRRETVYCPRGRSSIVLRSPEDMLQIETPLWIHKFISEIAAGVFHHRECLRFVRDRRVLELTSGRRRRIGISFKQNTIYSSLSAIGSAT